MTAPRGRPGISRVAPSPAPVSACRFGRRATHGVSSREESSWRVTV